MSRVLRKRTRVCYYEPEEPSFDEYIYCTDCRDYVYEYCSIHGPLLVVPDDKVPTPTEYSPILPRAALTIPKVFLHLAESDIPGAGIGVFSTLTLPAGVRFGPYRGARAHSAAGSRYCWQIFDREHKPSWLVDARDAAASNWMRYVNCSRHYSEQNLLAYQYQGQIYYRTIKIVPRMTELLVFYGSEFALELGVDLRSYRKSLPLIDLQRTVQHHELEENPTILTSQDKEEGSNNFTSMLVGNTSGHTAGIGDEEKDGDFVCEKPKAMNTEENTEQSNDESNNVVNQNMSICDESGRSCSEKTSLNEDISIHKMKEKTKPPTTSNVIMNYLCEICNSKFGSKSKLINLDIEEHDSKINYKACNQCNYKTESTYNLNRHMIIHTSENPYKCTLCDSKFNRRDQLTKHLRIHTAQDSLKRHFRTHNSGSYELKTPLNSHTGKKHYQCTACDSKFTASSYLKCHFKTHTDEKPYQCPVCDSKFGDSSKLKIHLRAHTGEKPYQCTVCDSKFRDSSNLKIHLRTHTGEKPYQCTVCDSKFRVSYQLKMHFRTHTGEKPYQCTVCESKFRDSSKLKIHLRAHTGEKPYQCTVCESKFRVSYQLKMHFRTHTGEKPYQCTVCYKKFSQKRYFKRHLKTHTGMP